MLSVHRPPVPNPLRSSCRTRAAQFVVGVQLRPDGRARTACSAFLLSTGANVAKHEALGSTPLLRVSDASEVRLTELWGAEETCVVVFARSFGCPFCQCDPASRLPVTGVTMSRYQASVFAH